MTSFHRRPVLVLAAAVGVLAPAAGALADSASAATLTANQACYVNVNPFQGAPMTLAGAGFTPGDTVDVSGGGVFTAATVDPTGAFTATAAAPTLTTTGPGTLKTTLTATSESTGAAISTVVRSANLAISTKPGSVRNVRKDKVSYSFSGFVPGKHIYGFWARKRIVARAKFGKASGPCGTLRQKALLYPGGRPHNNQYKVTFESTKKYSKRAFPRVTGVLRILRF